MLLSLVPLNPLFGVLYRPLEVGLFGAKSSSPPALFPQSGYRLRANQAEDNGELRMRQKAGAVVAFAWLNSFQG